MDAYMSAHTAKVKASVAHVKVFTNIFASTSTHFSTRCFGCRHRAVGFLVGDRIVILVVFSESSPHDECRERKGDGKSNSLPLEQKLCCRLMLAGVA